jgi:hypothetical protein
MTRRKLMQNWLRTALVVSIVATMAVVGIPAAEAAHDAGGLPWTVSEGAVPGSAPNTFDTGHFNFDYKTRGEQVIVGGDSFAGSGDLFTELGTAFVTGYFEPVTHDPIAGGTQLGAFGPTGYRLYATFEIHGESDFTANPGEIQGIFSDGTLSIFLDPASDTVRNADGSAVIDPSGDDLLVGTAFLITGESFVRASLASGDFEGIFAFSRVAPTGTAYWSAPNPFHILLNFNGNTTTFSGDVACDPGPAGGTGAPGDPCISFASGAGQGFFSRVPAPASVALLGLGLLVLGAVRRRISHA